MGLELELVLVYLNSVIESRSQYDLKCHRLAATDLDHRHN